MKSGSFCLVCVSVLSAMFGFLARGEQFQQPPIVTESLPVSGPFVLHRDGYTVCYEGRTKNPLWVYERLTKQNIIGPGRRKDKFSEDHELPKHLRSTLDDYRLSGYDRGHLAAAANHCYSQRAMESTFLLSNISPQAGVGFNRGIWKRLEERIRKVVVESLFVDVVSGPLYLPVGGVVSYAVIGRGSVAVPTHFFKIVVAESNAGNRSVEAYVLPNSESAGSKSLGDYQITVERVEALAGLVFNL